MEEVIPQQGYSQQTYGKSGNGLLWTFIIITLAIALAAIVMSFTMNYSKAQVDEKVTEAKTEAINDIIERGYTTCEPIMLIGDNQRYKAKYQGKTPRQICEEKDKEIISVEEYLMQNVHYGEGPEGPCDYRRLPGSFSIGINDYRFNQIEDEILTGPEQPTGDCEQLGGTGGLHSDLTMKIVERVFCC